MKKIKNIAELIRSDSLEQHPKFPAYVAPLAYSKEQIYELQNHRLRQILAYAKKHSPWYKRTLSHIDPEIFSLEQMDEIPIITKEIFMNNWDEIVTDQNLSLFLAESHLAKLNDNPDLGLMDNRYNVQATSGSSGKRGVFIATKEENIERFKCFGRFRAFDMMSWKSTNHHKKTRIAQVIVDNAIYGMYQLAKASKNDQVEQFFFPMTLPLEQVVYSLNKTQPDVLLCLPSIMFKLCHEAQSGRLKINPFRIIVGAEPLYPPIRTLIKRVWPSTGLTNAYGASEGVCGFNCSVDSTQMHLNSDYCLVEPVSADNKPTPKGVLSDKILITNLIRYTQPLIRYEISDRLIFSNKECSCGIALPLITEPGGRPELDFKYHGHIYVHHLIFVTPLLLNKAVNEYQVQQTVNGADIKIQCRDTLNKDDLVNEISKLLIELGLVEPQINIIEVASIDYPDSGKIRRFIPM